MALRSKDDWVTLFTTNGIPQEEATSYANIFVANRISDTTLSELTKADLIDLDITVLGDIKTILRLSQPVQAAAVAADTSSDHIPSQFMKIPAAQPPRVLPDMTHPQFRKFRTDWNVFKKITNLPDSQIHAQLYNSCDASVQNSLVNSVTNFFYLKLTFSNSLKLLSPKTAILQSTVSLSVPCINLRPNPFKILLYDSNPFLLIVSLRVPNVIMIYKIFTSKINSYEVLIMNIYKQTF